MFRVLIDLFNLLLWWSFMYVGSFLLLILGIVYITKTNPTPPIPIIHEHKIVQNIIQPPTEFSLNEIVSWRKSTNNLQ